jgi:putative ABC transport system permease protein
VRLWSELWERVRALIWRSAAERELEEELAFHLDKETEKNLARGLSPKAARREAYRRFGGVERQRERTREAWGVRGLEELARDVRLGARRLARTPAFTVAATSTLGLGIGGTSAMFAVVNALLLEPLPYPEHGRLVRVSSEAMITPANLAEWRAGVGALEEIGAFRLGTGVGSNVLTGAGAARVALVMPVSIEYLELLGATPLLGRVWSDEEGRAGAAPVALASERIWMEELGGAELAGSTVTVGGVRYDVVGVLPSDFHNMGYPADLWVPLSRAVGSLHLVARLRHGVGVDAAQREVDRLAERLPDQPGSDLLGRSVFVTSLREEFAGDVRAPVLVLFGASALVLLLAFANLASLLLSRATVRAREVSVRSALGAGRAQLLRPAVVECALLALSGAAAGLAFAWACLEAAVAVAPASLLEGGIGLPRIGPPVLAFTFLTTLALAAGAAVVPAYAGGAQEREGGSARSTATLRDRRVRDALVAAQVAVALVLLTGTVLLVRTYSTLRPASPGFEVADRLVAPLTLPGRRQIRDNLGPPPEDPANAELVRRLIASIEASAPGASAAAVTAVPLSGLFTTARVVAVDGHSVPAGDGRALEVDFHAATPGYLEQMGIRLLAGRSLAARDVAGAPNAIVVSESAARQLWPEAADPVGRTLTLDPYGADRPKPPDADRSPPAGPQILDFTVVGVAGDVRSSGAHTRSRPGAYVSFWQVPWPELHVVVHAPASARFTAEDVRAAVAALDPTVPVGAVTTVEALAGDAVARPRYEMTLMSVFALLAAALAVIGCYGVSAYSVSRRTREIGVRMALGATRRRVELQVLGRSAGTLTAGLLAGVLLANAFGRVLGGSLYGVSPNDPASLALATATLGAATLLAAWLPARRAGAVEPALVVKEE